MNKGETVVILHGWRLNPNSYNPLVQVLKEKNIGVYIPDMPGNGVAPAPEKPYTLDDYVEYMLKYLSTNKLRKFILVGHSFGGRVGIELSVKKPKLVKRLVLSGVPGIVPASQAKISIFLALAKMGNIVFSLPGLIYLKGFARRVLYRLARASDYYHTDGIMRETFKNIIRANLRASMMQLKLPTQLIWGEDDTVVPVNIANRMKKIIRGSKLSVIAEAGHDVIWTKPKDFVNQFIS